ncbi:hypothetical protein Pmani_016264 [Petrolisthes manimaculis]|uniref:Uncharacterized protein n=1 Tax=Petrolisthes manimaculis TaxID=1843537 RepID=A0AAE1PPS7_9EUCA|nr:hypothetical protein Pmani_016264 [Petrolisthes manimaculis]
MNKQYTCVLDIGFNLLSAIPDNGFLGVRALTLLALDGNPLTTVPEQAFTHLNTSLRGLSVGGRFLHCDCRVGWISRWITNYDLQVTSRERNPQFCGQPPEYRERSFYQLSPDEPPPPPPPATTPINTINTRTLTTPQPRPEITSFRPGEVLIPGSNNGVGRVGSVQRGPGGKATPPERTGGGERPPTRSQQRPSLIERPPSQPVPSRPNLVTRTKEDDDASLFFGGQPYDDEVIVQDAYRKDSSVIIQWDSEVSNILGFRVVYRLFGDKTFKLGPPLAASEREFKIKNVPTQECIVVCVVSLEDATVTPENVQYSQCREIRTETSAAMHMDTIIIAASAAICGTVIIAVIVFICCNRKRSDAAREKQGIPAVLSPSSAPLASLGTLGSGMSGPATKADWDTLSMYSQRSIPRARMYHMDKGSVNNGFIPDDARSHISHISSKHIPRPRSMADGQSQRSYSALSSAHLRHPASLAGGLGLSRHDLSMSRQSLATSHLAGFGPMAVNPNAFGLAAGIHHRPPSTTTMLSRATSQRSDRNRRHSRSKSRERASSRLSHAGSTHSLTGYDTDGWTDHDMDIYVARNPTRGGLVQL